MRWAAMPAEEVVPDISLPATAHENSWAKLRHATDGHDGSIGRDIEFTM